MGTMKNRYYLLTVSGFGGEFCIGQVNRPFVEFWADRDADALAGHLLASGDVKDERHVTDSPDMLDDGTREIYEVDDIVHINSPESKCEAEIIEIKISHNAEFLKGSIVWKDGSVDDEQNLWIESSKAIKLDLDLIIASQEVTSSDPEPANKKVIPIVQTRTIERGTFYNAIVRTDASGFDQRLLRHSTLETDMGDFIDRIWYGQQELILNLGETVGKDFAAKVGYWNPEYDGRATAEEIAECHIEADANLMDDND